MIRRWLDFLSRDLWRMRLHGRPGMVSFWLNQLRIVVLAFRGFSQDKCRLRASALTLYLLMSLVPMVAVIFGVARGFGIEKEVEKRVMASFKGEVQVSEFAAELERAEPVGPNAGGFTAAKRKRRIIPPRQIPRLIPPLMSRRQIPKNPPN